MNENTKLAGAALGGYVLGRTKKGKAAIRLAMWLSGDQGQQVIAFTRNGITTLIASQAGQQLIGSVREQAQNRTKALTSGLTENLNERTKSLGGGATEGGKKVAGSLGRIAGKGKQDDDEQDQPQDQTSERDDQQDEPEEDWEDQRRGELGGMGVRALRAEAKKYYETDSLKNASRADLIEWVIQAEEEERNQQDDDDEEEAEDVG